MTDPKEPEGNIGHVCSDCAPKPGGYKDQPLAFFVGKIVKLGFPTGLEDGPSLEHMWVQVKEVVEEEGKPALKGVLDNDPAFAPGGCGDLVVFTVDEIEDVYIEGEPS